MEAQKEHEALQETEIDHVRQTIAQILADLTRINALGQRLVTVADLDPVEFDFTTTPGVGEGIDTLAGVAQMAQDLNNYTHMHLTKLNILADMLHNQTGHRERQLTGKGWPVMRGWISSLYGMRIDPITGRRSFHHGLDIAAPLGDPLYALAGGVVTWAGKRPGYGNLVEIDHGGDLKTRFGHVRNIKVKLGQVVRKGQQIAEVGNEGRSTGAHVHLEVREKDKTRDPKTFFAFK